MCVDAGVAPVEGLGSLIIVEQSRVRTLASPAALQLASGALGATLGLAFLCPAVGAAGLGALADGRRYAAGAATLWRGVFAAVATLAAASVAYPFFVAHDVSGWPMLAFALLGLVVNLACVLAAVPQRLSGLHPLGVRASSAGYSILAGAGAAALLRPGGWACVVAVIAIVLALAAERLLDGATRR